jgi:outer membrane protein TolC
MVENANAAAAKLVYLLGLDPCTQLVAVDQKLVPIDLIPNLPTCDLVAQALATGPGVAEMEEILNLIQETIEDNKGPAKYMPVLGLRMAEGGFGAGSGDWLNWDNRWDLGLQARWNLTEFANVKARRRVSSARIQQAHISYQDLRNRLTAGVRASHETIQSGQDIFRFTRSQISHSREAFRLAKSRYTQGQTESKSAIEVLLAIRSLTAAQSNYLGMVRDYDRAQLQLLVLLGGDPGIHGGAGGGGGACPGGACPAVKASGP